MTAANLAKHRNNPNMAFWKMIKEGSDHFEVSHQEPKVDFCEKKYVFDAIRAPNTTRDPVFNASAKCPPYAIADDLADAVRAKQEADNAEYAKLVSKGVPVAKLNTGIDGGMNQIFASHVPGASTGLSEGGDGQGLALASLSRMPGTIPGTVNPPRAPWQQADEPVAAVASTPAAQPAPTRVASAAPAESKQSEGWFTSLAHKVGFGSAAADTTASAAPAKPKAESKPLPKAFKPAETKQAEAKPAARPALKPSVSDAPATAAAPPAAPVKDNMVAGAQPIMQSNSFDSRFSAMK
jgi:cell division septation protein DedD